VGAAVKKEAQAAAGVKWLASNGKIIDVGDGPIYYCVSSLMMAILLGKFIKPSVCKQQEAIRKAAMIFLFVLATPLEAQTTQRIFEHH
jgi:hypothetical protein